MKYTERTIKWCIIPDGAPLFDELATDIEVVDEAAGEFVEVIQHTDGCGKIQIDPEEWPTIRKAIDNAVKLCRK
jgi:hypothetical protein